MVCLAMGCLYLGEINYPPEVTLTPVDDGPYYRGMAIRLRADTTDRNASADSPITFTWTLTDDSGRPLGSDEVGDCGSYDSDGCFVPLALGVVYRMTVTAADDRGAKGTAYRDFTVTNQKPTAVLDATGRKSAADSAHYVIHQEIRFSGLGSTDPDAGDKCRLTYTYETVSRPLASVTGVFVEEPCSQKVPPPGCTADAPTWCITPDAPGTYGVRVTVTDPAGDSSSMEKDVVVDPDAPPCLAQLVPLPIPFIWVARSDGTRRFSVNVDDELDPWPPTDTNATGFPAFTWSLQTASDPAPVKIPDYLSNQYELDLLAFSAGEEVLVRVDLADRVDRTQTSPCAIDETTCPPDADPLAADACVQRVTWTLKVY